MERSSQALLYLFMLYSVAGLDVNDMEDFVGKLSPEDHKTLACPPCNCELNKKMLMNRLNSKPMREKFSAGDTLMGSARAHSSSDPEAREERINESMARFMQLMTFFGHIDNFITQKTNGLIKIMGKAVDSSEDDEEQLMMEPHQPYPPQRRYYKSRRPYQDRPKISTTITS